MGLGPCAGLVLLALIAPWAGRAAGLLAGDYVVTDAGLDAIVRVDPLTGDQEILSAGNFLSFPFDLVEEPGGSLAVACAGNGSIVRVDPSTGAQSLVALGNGLLGPSGIAVLADGTLAVADADARAIWSVDPVTGDVTALSLDPALEAPIGIGLSAAGDLYVTDPDHGGGAAVLGVDPVDGSVSVVSQSSLLGVPFHLDVEEPGGTLVVTDSGRSTVLRVDPASGATSTVASGSPADASDFDLPFGVALDADGDLVVVDGDADTPAVWSVAAANGLQTEVSSGSVLELPLGMISVSVPAIAVPLSYPLFGNKLEVSTRRKPGRWEISFKGENRDALRPAAYDPTQVATGVLLRTVGGDGARTPRIMLDETLWRPRMDDRGLLKKWVYKDKRGSRGGVTKAVIKDGQLVIKGAGRRWTWTPGGDYDEVWVHFYVDTVEMCSRFAAAEGVVSKNKPKLFEARGALAPDPCPTAVCGNGELDDGEACDDGNLDEADGCTTACEPSP